VKGLRRMEASIEEHSAVLLSLVQEIHAQPQALVGPMEARLKEELAGVDMRVRCKIQELPKRSVALQPQEEAARGEVQRGEGLVQEDLVEERLKDQAERRASECEEEGSLSITEVNAHSPDGVDSKKRELLEDENGGHDGREEQKAQKMSSGDDREFQRMFLETPSPPSLQLDDDEGEVAARPFELEKKRGRNEDGNNDAEEEEEEEQLKHQRVQNVEEPLQEENVDKALASVVEVPEVPDAAVSEGGSQKMDLGGDGDEIQQEQCQDVEDEEGCMYAECSQLSGSIVQCDGCDKWFHPQCAGYERGLLENPSYDGHPIELKAYCHECLDDMKLSHADIVDQEMEYLMLEKFFQANAASWTWQPVSRNGLCLNAIWKKHPGSFESLDKLIAAAAIASIDEVDKHANGSPADKRHCKVVFGNLAKDPDKLADMWPDLEVQCMWHALVNSVFKDLKLNVHALEDYDGNALLRCMQTIPDETADREFTINLLRWNQKVAVHYDLLEEVDSVCLPDEGDDVLPDSVAKVVEAVKVVEDVVPVVIEQAVPAGSVVEANNEDGSDTGDEEKKIDEPEQTKKLADWGVGTLLEAEMLDPNFPNYTDTLHPVKVVEVLDGGKKYRCQLLAFDGENNVDEWDAEFLHDPREHDKNAEWKKGDKVHFRIRKRKVGKAKVDGAASNKGIWAKGVVVEGLNKKSGRVVVEHVAWGSMGDDGGELQKKLTHVLPTDIRWAKPCNDVVFQKEVDPLGHFNVETERARLARGPLTKEDWQSVEKKNMWVKSGIVDRMLVFQHDGQQDGAGH
jgi:hypothetical protein